MTPSEAGSYLGSKVSYILAGELLESVVRQVMLCDSGNIYVELKSGVFLNINDVVLEVKNVPA